MAVMVVGSNSSKLDNLLKSPKVLSKLCGGEASTVIREIGLWNDSTVLPSKVLLCLQCLMSVQVLLKLNMHN
jgi:hypothetical protein